MRPRRTLRFCVISFVVPALLACAPRIPVSAPTIPAPPLALAEAPDSFFYAAPDVRIRFRETGQGSSIILIHGLGRSLTDWAGVGDSLARDHRVVALDVRGFGKSSRVSTREQLGREMANDVIKLLDLLEIRRAHLVGHSTGAAIAAYLATRHPDRVRSVTLIAVPFNEDTTAFTRDEGAFAADIEQGRGMMKLLRWLFPTYPESTLAAWDKEVSAGNDPATVGAAMRSMDMLSVRPSAAGKIRSPALVLVGSGDPLVPQSRWIASWWPRARIEEVAGTDHFTILNHPVTLASMRMMMRAAPP
jgi:pimeloyl-ACP methyl ester carboxylesterase